jgi:opacity protein-like surface antigen
MRRVVAAVVAAIVAVVASARRADAQVGHTPERSPFSDIEYRQSFTTLGGYFFAKDDPAHVAPQSGPFVGVQYDIYLGGPASFTSRIGSAIVDRSVIDPARPASRRFLGTERRPLTMADVGFTFALTGQKSYRGFVPLVHGGVGLVSNFKGSDPGGLSLGTRFAFAYGLGMRYVPAGRLAVRADLGYHAYQLRYPDRYFEPALDSTSVLPSTHSKSAWLNNKTVTVGVSYQLFR